MSTLSPDDAEHVFEKLRAGLVPERGLEAYMVGIDKYLGEIRRQLAFVAKGEGNVKFLRGDYGCGKTFTARLAVLEAQRKGFATSFVVVSDNDLKFHRFDDVYRKVVSELGTSACPRGALGDILDRWIAKVEDALIESGADEDADDFDAKVMQRIEADLAAMTGGNAPPDFVRVIQKVFELKQAGDLGNAGALLSWLAGSGNVASAVKKLADIKGDIGSRDAMEYLRGIVGIVHAAGYKGLLIVIDEAETILRMRKDSRHGSLNGIRQISDAAGSYQRLLWIFTGTPEFFDSRRGVAGLSALHDRIKFSESGGFANVKQPQIQLQRFDRDRLLAVSKRLRDEFPTEERELVESKITDDFLEDLVDRVTAGFKGDVGLVPRQYLREFVNCLDRAEQDPDWQPMELKGKAYEPQGLTAEEEHRLEGVGSAAAEAAPDDSDDAPVPVEDVW